MHPRAIAVIGASDAEGKIGNSVMQNLVNGGFEGEIYPINPKADEILGKKVYADVSDLPDGVDVAVFAIPAKFVRRHDREGRRQGHRRRRHDPVRASPRPARTSSRSSSSDTGARARRALRRARTSTASTTRPGR